MPVKESEPAVLVQQVAHQPIATVQAASADKPPPSADEPGSDVTAEQAPASVLVAGEEAPQGASVTRPQAQDGETTDNRVAYDIMLGAMGATPQYGLIGEVSGRKVALDLNQTHTISLFGVQGGGKS